MLKNKALTMILLLASFSSEMNMAAINSNQDIRNSLLISEPEIVQEEQDYDYINTISKPLMEEALKNYYNSLSEIFPHGFNFQLKALVKDLGTDGIHEILVSVDYDFISTNEYSKGAIFSGTEFSILYYDIDNHSVHIYELPYHASVIKGLAYPNGFYVLVPAASKYRVLFENNEIVYQEEVFNGDTLRVDDEVIESPDSAEKNGIMQTKEENAKYYLYLNEAESWDKISVPINGYDDINKLFQGLTLAN